MTMTETAARAYLDQKFAAITDRLAHAEPAEALAVAHSITADGHPEAGRIVGDGIVHAFYAGDDY